MWLVQQVECILMVLPAVAMCDECHCNRQLRGGLGSHPTALTRVHWGSAIPECAWENDLTPPSPISFLSISSWAHVEEVRCTPGLPCRPHLLDVSHPW
jgi:hypothetical protein